MGVQDVSGRASKSLRSREQKRESSETIRLKGLEQDTRAGEAGFGFLEFGDVEGSDVESFGFDAGARAREGCGKDHRVGERQGVCRVWFGGIDFDPVVSGKRSGVEPGAVGKERISAKKGDGGLEV